jgi:CzcA family heavy metal efflux pump
MMMTDWMQKHRRSLLFLLVVLILGGVGSAFRLPVGLFPLVNFPRVRVSLDAGDRPADRMAIEVTRAVEEAVRGVPGVRGVRSTTSRGTADIDVNFEWGQDMVAAMLQVQSAIQQAGANFPSGTTTTVTRMDPTVFPVLAYSLTSDTRSGTELRDIALYQLRPLLSTVKGVGRLGIQGGQTEEFRVTVDPVRLNALGLTFDDAAKALAAANVIRAVGRLEDHDKLYLLLSDTQFKNLEEIGRTVLRSGPAGVVLLKDVAQVLQTPAPNWTRATADGHDAVLLQVYQQLNGNTVQIARDIKEALAGFQPHLPPGVHIANWYDQSEIIQSSAGSVRDALLVGVVMAALILLLFLRNLKVTLIAIVTVPGVLAITVLLLNALNMGFNVMTLGGMAAAVGLIIDDAIVMVEHIVRRMRGGEGAQHGRVMKAAREFTRPLAGSSMATIIIFVPLAFLSGVTGAFFKALSITMASALVVSFFVAWLAVPLLAERFLNEKDAAQEEGGPFTERLHATYGKLMGRLFARPVLLLAGLVPFLLVGWLGYHFLGSGFMPSMDEGGFVLDYRSPSGTSLSETDRLAKQVEAILRATPDVRTYSRRTGLQLGGSLTEANEGDFFVRLKDFPRRPIGEVIAGIRSQVEKRVPGLEVEMAKLMEDLIGDLTAVPQPIEIKIFSDDEATLLATAPKVADAIRKIPGVVDVKDGIVLAGDALDLRVDRVRAALEGIDPETVTSLAEGYLDGIVQTQVQQGPKMVGVRIWTPPEPRRRTRDLETLILRAPDGHLFPLGRVATVTPVTGQPQIMRDDLKRMLAVTGRISGRDMGSVVADVKRVLAGPGLMPKVVYTTLGGLYEQQRIAFQGLMAVFLAAVALVFFLLLFLFERFRPALCVMLTALLALSAVFVGLWVTGTELNISSMMGMTMVLGIVTEVAIFLVWEFMASPPQLDDRSALIEAGKHRLRAITMSTLAAILALSPLALGLGHGADMQRPLAIAIISGMAFQLPLVFLVLPTLFIVLGVRRKPGAVSSNA